MLKPSIGIGECDQITIPDVFQLSGASTVTIIDTVNCCDDPFIKVYSANGACFKDIVLTDKTFIPEFNDIVSLKINTGGTFIEVVPTGNKLQLFNNETSPEQGLHPDTNLLKNRVNATLESLGLDDNFDIVLNILPLPPNPIGNPPRSFTLSFTFSGLALNYNPLNLCLQSVSKTSNAKKIYEFTECNTTSDSILPINDFGLLVLNPSFFNSDLIPIGIHNVTIKIDYNIGSVFQQNYCNLVDCDIVCKLASLNPESSNYIKLLNYYNGLINMLQCTSVDCSCTKACEMYEFIVSELNKSVDLQGDNDCKTC